MSFHQRFHPLISEKNYDQDRRGQATEMGGNCYSILMIEYF